MEFYEEQWPSTSPSKKNSIVFACRKIHNYLMPEDEMPINFTDESIDEVGTEDDSVMNADGLPEGLLHGGGHREDVVESDLWKKHKKNVKNYAESFIGPG